MILTVFWWAVITPASDWVRFEMGAIAKADSPPWTLFHSRLHQQLRSPVPESALGPAAGSVRTALLPRGQRIVIAVSGGQDSVALARLLYDLQPKWVWQLAIAHCNHRWHPRETEAAAQVERLAQEWQLPFYLRVAQTPPPGEAAARHWRYQQLIEIAGLAGAAVVVTGHTASDRAETLLHNLARGSGLDGLSALGWQRSLTPHLQLVRPLLGFSRAETAIICQQLALPVWQDPVNADLHYTRNRLRHTVIPCLQAQVNPQAEAHLAQTAELLQADVAYLEQQAEHLRLSLEREDGLQRQRLREAPLALQRRVVRQFLQQRLPQQPNAHQVEKFVGLLAAPRGSQSDPFPGGKIAQVQEDWVRLQGP